MSNDSLHTTDPATAGAVRDGITRAVAVVGLAALALILFPHGRAAAVGRRHRQLVGAARSGVPLRLRLARGVERGGAFGAAPYRRA